MRTFKTVRRLKDYGFFHGKQKDTMNAVVFASVATLGRAEYLDNAYFARDYFDYIVIDEFHHVVNEQYRRIVDYFEPRFLLGLTATPERMDGKNIYGLCNYNVPYEISMKEAINKGMLAPFRYYGIYDETDYSSLHLVKGKYIENELTNLYKKNVNRYDLIYKHYQKYRSKAALGFCCSRAHAEKMAEEFCKRGIPSVAVYSGSKGVFSEERQTAIEKLKNQEVRVIFSVDMFNEGIDIATIDMVLFLRSTESPIVFLQQLGRGLRICHGKEYLTVLDFIGNYEKAGKAPLLLSGEKSFRGTQIEDYTQVEYPDDCIVDFDMRLIDLFREANKKTVSIKERIRKEFYQITELLNGRIPSRMELFMHMEDDVYQYCMSHAKENPFRQYLDYLHEVNALSDKEQLLFDSIGKEFLALIETTDMTKVYKMPILYAFYNNGDVLLDISTKQVLKAWKDFFNNNRNWRDFSKDISYDTYKKMTDKQHIAKARSMPIRFLKASGKGFFVEKEGYEISICDELEEVLKNEAFQMHMKDILEYRTMEYYRRRYTS